MKKIIIKQLSFRNFKGIKDLAISFQDILKNICKIIDIFGENGTGKSTIFDAFTWLLGGLKNLEERMLDKSKANEGLLKEKNNLYELKGKLREMEFKAEQEKNKPLDELKINLINANRDIQYEETMLKEYQNKSNDLQRAINNIKTDIEGLRNKWYEVNSKELVFDEKAFIQFQDSHFYKWEYHFLLWWG